MAKLVSKGAMIKCSFGTAPATLSSLTMKVKVAGNPACTINDYVPNVCIPSFGMCQSLANPQVAAATAAAYGALTPQPCTPMTTAPWAPGSPKVLIEGKVALNDYSVAMCAYAGVIEVTFAGQVVCDVP